MLRLCKLTDRTITNFCGIFWGGKDIDMAYDVMKEGYHCIMTHHKLLTGLMTLGFDTVCLISLNLWPERVREIHHYMCNWKLHEAHGVFTKLTDSIRETCKVTSTECDVIEIFKHKFNTLVDFSVGDIRKPKHIVIKKW